MVALIETLAEQSIPLIENFFSALTHLMLTLLISSQIRFDFAAQAILLVSEYVRC